VNWRRYHRWLAVPFGLILLWVALTGIAMQGLEIYDKGLFGDDDDRPALVTSLPAATPAATPVPPRPQQSKAHQLHELLQHLHSGEWFGPFGTIIQSLAGLAMLFFTVSGMWLYFVMYRRRSHKHHDGRKLFW
jgi:uncharacterized iron-regulated membrane protein